MKVWTREPITRGEAMRRPTNLLALLLPVALVAMALAMSVCASLQRTAATHADERTDGATEMLTALIDQETGLRGFLLAGEESFLEPFRGGRDHLTAAEGVVRRTAAGDRATLQLIRQHGDYERQWEAMARVQIAVKRADQGYHGTVSEALERKGLMDHLRAINATLQQRLVARRDADLSTAARKSWLIIIGLTLVLGLAAIVLLRRDGLRRKQAFQSELDHRTSQREFTDIIQVVRSEPEAHQLLKRHLELTIPTASATVLNRNNSDNRLEATTDVPAGSPLAERLAGAEPSSCLAVRLGRRHRGRHGEETLLSCSLCGLSEASAACEPLLVGGQVIGSVLIEHDRDLGDSGERRLAESVIQAAPVLANLRNLALAERRAATDPLTGLPNRRAVQDGLKRMAAQALRSGRPLAAIALDLDRFKDINDRFGHEAGDTVLAHVGALLSTSVRAGDLVGRLGGEEFIILAPDTDATGAATLAENLRAALAREGAPGVEREVTASFGVAVLPDHAQTAEALLRLSDGAQYAAKAEGRNRVVVAPSAVETIVDPVQ
jgi:diguanylate cyclase (GGDEF)-like protein